MTADLASWLLEQIAADEAVAQEAAVAGAQWKYAESYGAMEIRAEDGTNITSDREGLSDSVQDFAGPHIARHDPAHVLAVCEAHRRIVAEHPAPDYIDEPGARLACDRCSDLGGPYGGDNEEDWVDWPCPTLRALAAIYADRDGFREEWR